MSNRFLAVSYNIQWGLGLEGKVQLERIFQTLMGHGTPDVICLQEVAQGPVALDGFDGTDQVAWFKNTFPEHACFYAPSFERRLPDGRWCAFGNLTLCRLPVLSVQKWTLPNTVYDLALPYLQRVGLEVSCMAGDRPLRMLNTHLEYYCQRQRTEQLAFLRRLHEQAHHVALGDEALWECGVHSVYSCAKRPLDILLCGDLNCTPDAPELQWLLAPFESGVEPLVDLWATQGVPLPARHTVGLNGHPWPDQPYCCDYFIASESLARRVERIQTDPLSTASDHQPVFLHWHS